MMFQLRFCDQCGFEAGADARFCPSCGASLRDDATPNEPARQLTYEQGRQLAMGSRRTPGRWWRGRTAMVVVALVGVALVYGAYNAAAAMTYSSAREAHIDKHCSDAIGRYEWVAGFFALSLATSRSEADRSRAECRAVLEARDLSRKGDYMGAADAYAAAADANPDSPIRDFLMRGQGEALLAEAGDARDYAFAADNPTSLGRAVGLFDRVRDELPAYGAATTAEHALDQIEARLYRTALTAPCTAESLYEGLVGESASVRAEMSVEDAHPRAMFRCANASSAKRNYANAKELFSRLILEYPSSPLVPSARRGLIATEIAKIRSGRTSPLPNPDIVGSSGTGEVDLTVENASPYPLELLVSGPTPRKVLVPKCSSCREYPRGSQPATCSGPSRTVTLAGGQYAIVVRSKSANVRNWTGDRSLVEGYRYDLGCLFIVTSSG